jgi:23S rRNA pseudouridine2605 synthase
VLEVVLHEGRNRQVRRMAEAVGHPVLTLHRPRYGPLRLGRLRAGGWRMLAAAEVEALRAAAGLESPA